MEMMGALIVGRFGEPRPVEAQRNSSTNTSVLGPDIFSRIWKVLNSVFYGSVGQVGRLFMEIGMRSFRMSAR